MSMASSRIVGFNTESVTSWHWNVDFKKQRANLVLSQIRTVNFRRWIPITDEDLPYSKHPVILTWSVLWRLCIVLIFASTMHQNERFQVWIFKIFLGRGSPSLLPRLLPRYVSGFALGSGFALDSGALRALVCPPEIHPTGWKMCAPPHGIVWVCPWWLVNCYIDVDSEMLP